MLFVTLEMSWTYNRVARAKYQEVEFQLVVRPYSRASTVAGGGLGGGGGGGVSNIC